MGRGLGTAFRAFRAKTMQTSVTLSFYNLKDEERIPYTHHAGIHYDWLQRK
jgi:hypothetical protein